MGVTDAEVNQTDNNKKLILYITKILLIRLDVDSSDKS